MSALTEIPEHTQSTRPGVLWDCRHIIGAVFVGLLLGILLSLAVLGVLTLLGLEETGSGWTAVVQIGTATPVNLPAGKVLRFG